MDKMLHRPIVAANPVIPVLEKADACLVGAMRGHMPNGCESLDVEVADTDGDGKLNVTIGVSATGD